MTTTLQGRPKTRKVLRHLMEKQQAVEIGERVRELRENSEETNRSIADYCNVGERTVAGWVAGDGISYKNAKKVAELFAVSIDWLWRGREPGPTPDLMGTFGEAASSSEVADLRKQLDRIEEHLSLLLADRGLESDEQPSEQQGRKRNG